MCAEDGMSSDTLLSPLSPGVVSADILASVSGLEFLEGIRDGRFPPPPIAALLGFYPVEVERGRAVFEARPDSRLYNPMGSVHGGYIATLLDSCMGCAVHSKSVFRAWAPRRREKSAPKALSFTSVARSRRLKAVSPTRAAGSWRTPRQPVCCSACQTGE